MLADSRNEVGLKTERSMVRVSIATMRILLGIFFLLSGIANYMHFNADGGFFEAITQSKLRLWGLGFEGIGPLPPFISLPYAYLLPAIELVVAVLFIINRWVRWAAIVMAFMLFSFIIAFGLFPPDGLLPNNQANWDKNVFMLLGAWICGAYDHYRVKRQEKISEL